MTLFYELLKTELKSRSIVDLHLAGSKSYFIQLSLQLRFAPGTSLGICFSEWEGRRKTIYKSSTYHDQPWSYLLFLIT